MMAMVRIAHTAREWWLTALCAFLILAQIPQGIELAYPILDFKGGNQFNMEVERDFAKNQHYHCGDVVMGHFKFQKQREASGTIKWELIKNSNFTGLERVVKKYPPRPAAGPAEIINHWAPIEPLPEVCEPGKYHFQGTISYPVLFGLMARATYTLRTVCFEVQPK
jgi:hypothetical protein